MELLRRDTTLTRMLAEAGAFAAEPFHLIDVGCSGGIDVAWRAFEPSLVAHGFDPMIDMCEGLQASERNPNVHYHARFVGLPPDHQFAKRRREDLAIHGDGSPWERLSTAAALRQHIPEGVTTNTFNSPRMAEEKSTIGVSDFVHSSQIATVDFIKIDIDGGDIEALVSAEQAITTKRVLGVGIEVNYFGLHIDTANSFHNIDRLLRQLGFCLCGLTVRPYSRQYMPSPFLYEFIGQTSFGPPLQGDAVYLRSSSGAPAILSNWGMPKCLKLLSLFDLFGLPDCAAEVILSCGPQSFYGISGDAMLDVLTPELNGRSISYAEYMATFKTDIRQFMPSARPPSKLEPDPEIDRLRDALARFREEAETQRVRAEALDQEARSLRRSTSWRVTSPFRTLSRLLRARVG
jgi:hypothetical protein